ncbi:uncharacterized protein LOC110942571 isoform X4 [Helianthus annuus]|uniref:uncharacterized protein LOC110942571 isoform X4 n=1 Tax=Helianthus annuus TaxID=4232 RepID=UPI000B8FE4FC|nr:uncharacterized protein LOC110942571 isoform X4 [Helianthus annuus]
MSSSSTQEMAYHEYIRSLKIPREEIELATNNFSDDNFLTQGTTYTVYKGQLLLQQGDSINIVARKCPQSVILVTEVEVLKDLKHKHIVSIYKLSGTEDEGIIINKYEANESLDKHLSSPTLTWMRRLHICVGVAHALSYLHYDAAENHYVIHGNIRSSKILLDHNWEPKLHGFKFAVKARKHHLHLTGKYNGSLHYMDPAYEDTRGLNHKSDVFSFGVLLFEVLFGREASIPNDDNWYFARMARAHYEERKLDDLIDPVLRKQMNLQSLNMFAEIAYCCIKEKRSQRPDMKTIRTRLERALELQGKYEQSTVAAVEGTTSNHFKGKSLDHLRLRLTDIELATDKFSETCCIGSGGYGMVYKAELDHFDGMNSLKIEEKNKGEFRKKHSCVAIKRLHNRVDAQGEQGFVSEIETLSNCKHPNIVSLLGFCDEGRELILVYEYVAKGSLDDYLGNMDGLNNLLWAQRLQICLDIAHGLNYLHTHIEGKPMIIHRDIKSANILLDDNWVAKIADFGLSKLQRATQQGTTLITNNIAGTEVYLDPEYKNTGKLKKESDIYSFGVVLFEVLCGRLAYDEIYGGRGLPSVARQRFNDGTFKEMVDPKLMEADEIISMLKGGVNQDSLETFSKIAHQCLAETQSGRPTMEVIIKELEKALNFQEDYEIWEPKLPIDYKEIIQVSKNPQIYKQITKKGLYDMFSKGILLQGDKVWFSIGSNGDRNEMISSKRFSYKDHLLREWRSIPVSRFPKVAEMLNISNLNIQIKIRTQFLSPCVNYKVHLIFRFRGPRKSQAKRMYVNLKYKMGNESLNAYFATWREDGWMMIELFQFLNHKKDTDFEVLLEGFSRCYCGSDSIYIEGIQFQAIDNARHEAIENHEEIRSLKWLPFHMSQSIRSFQNGLKNFVQVKHKEIEKLKDVYQAFKSKSKTDKLWNLPNPMKEKKDQTIWFSLCQIKKKKDEMLFANEDMLSTESGFTGAIECSRQQILHIKCKIKRQMLLENTQYTCYLVFKLSEKCHGLHGPVIVRDLFNWRSKETGVLYFRHPNPWNVRDTDWVPRQRKDGWMEVIVWKFNSNYEPKNDHLFVNLKLITYEGTMSGLIVRGIEFRPI